MNEAYQLARRYDHEVNALKCKFSFASQVFITNNFIQKITETYDDITRNNVFEKYKITYDRYQETEDELIKDALHQSLIDKYHSICLHQTNFINVLNIDFHGEMNAKILNHYFSKISNVNVSINILYETKLKSFLKDLEDIHEMHNTLFVKSQDEIIKDEQLYDETFLEMTTMDIEKQSIELMEQITSNKKQYEREKGIKK